MSSDDALHGLTIEAVELTVADRERMVAFYTGAIGLVVREQQPAAVALGTAGRTLLVLRHDPAAPPRPARTSGLYHFALLLPERRDLAAALQQLVLTRTPIGGAADHGVSEALYLDDPEGNGIEIAWDRPAALWPLRAGRLQMTSDPLDLQALLALAPAGKPADYRLAAASRIGHLHLNVADLARSEAFYCAVLGLQLMQHYGAGAIFVAADGYHHHFGLNVWNGRGAPPPPPHARGIYAGRLQLADAGLSALAARLSEAEVPYAFSDDRLTTHDPDGHRLEFCAA